MKKKVIQFLKFFAFLVLGLLLLWFAFRNINFRRLADGLREAKYIWLILSILFATFAYISRARRWNLLIQALGYKPKLKNAFFAMMTGYLANMALPRIGEISKCVALGRKENIPVDQLIGTVVIERTIDFLSLTTIMVIMIFVEKGILGPFLLDNIFTPTQQRVASMFGSAIVFWLLLLFSGFLILFIIFILQKRLVKIRFFAKIFIAGRGIIHGLKTIARLKRKWEFVFHTFFIWLNYFLMTWVVVFAVEATSHLNIADGLFLLVVGGLAMTAPVQSGLGAFHFIVSRALLVIYGISTEDGLVYAILAHESQVIFGAIIGIYSFYALVKKDPGLSPLDDTGVLEKLP